MAFGPRPLKFIAESKIQESALVTRQVSLKLKRAVYLLPAVNAGTTT